MLPRAHRLTRANWSAMDKGKRAASAHFSVTVAPSAEGRASAVVSKKVAKRSVDRHLLKRRMLAVAAPYVQPGHSFILYARAGALTLPYQALKGEITTLLTNLPKV